MFQTKPIPTHHTPSMNTESQLISLPCHFHNQPFHDYYMPRFIQVHHSQLIHPPTHAYSFPSCHYIIIKSNTSQTSRTWRTLNHNALSPSSLPRLKGLAQARGSFAQASSLRLGESSTHRNSGLRAFSLRRVSPCLSETLARSKLRWSLEQPLA